MVDHNGFTKNGELARSDKQGYWKELAHWSPLVANRLADADGLTLDEDHWQVIYYLREHFRVLGPDWTARRVTQSLGRAFADAGGRRHLYQLFPRGPLVQGCHLAGLPVPQGTLSASFGSVH